MKYILALLVVLVTPEVCAANVLNEEPPEALTIVEPVLLAASSFLAVHNGRFIEKRSLFWSCLGMAMGTATLALSTSDAMHVPALTAVCGTATFFISFARLPRPAGRDTPSRAAGLEMGWRSAQFVVRF